MWRSVSPSFQMRDAPRLAVAFRDDDAFDLGAQRRRPILTKLALSSLKCVCAVSPSALFGSAVADHQSPLSASRRNRKLPIRSSLGSACQRVTAMSPQRL